MPLQFLLAASLLSAGCCMHSPGTCGTACGDGMVTGEPLLDSHPLLASPCRSCGRVHGNGPHGQSPHGFLPGEQGAATQMCDGGPGGAPLLMCQNQPDCLRPEYLLGFGWPLDSAPVPPPPVYSAAFTNELPPVRFLPVPARPVF